MVDTPVQQPNNNDLVNALFSELKDSETIQVYKDLLEGNNLNVTPAPIAPNEANTVLTEDQLQPAPIADSSFYTQILDDLKQLTEQNSSLEQQLDTGFKGFTTDVNLDKDIPITSSPSLDFPQSTLTEFENVIKKYFDNTVSNNESNEQTPFSSINSSSTEPTTQPFTLNQTNPAQNLQTNLNSNIEPRSQDRSVFETKPFNMLSQKSYQPPSLPFTASVINTPSTQSSQLFNRFSSSLPQTPESFNLSDIQKLLSDNQSTDQLTTFINQNNQSETPTAPFLGNRSNNTPVTQFLNTPFSNDINVAPKSEQIDPFKGNNFEQIQNVSDTAISSSIPAVQPQNESTPFNSALLETSSEMPGRDTWSNISISDPALEETAHNTATTNELLKQLTQAIFALAGSSGGNAGMPPPPAPSMGAPSMGPSMGGQNSNRLSETVPVIPSIRGEFL